MRIYIVFLLFLSACFAPNEQKTKVNSFEEVRYSTNFLILKTVYGTTTFQLYPSKAPIAVRRFKELIQRNFFQGLTFFQVSDFYVRSGDPTNTGKGSSGSRILDETNELPLFKGSLALVKTSAPDSADSQFIVVKKTPIPLQHYLVIGRVTKGLEVLDQIEQGDKVIQFTLQTH